MRRSVARGRIRSITPRHRHRDRDLLARQRLASWSTPVRLRLGAGPDLPRLELLAELETRPLPPGPHLVAERGGRIEAALSLSSGGLVADPFIRTAELCELLRCFAGDLRLSEQRRPAELSPRPQLVTA